MDMLLEMDKCRHWFRIDEVGSTMHLTSLVSLRHRRPPAAGIPSTQLKFQNTWICAACWNISTDCVFGARQQPRKLSRADIYYFHFEGKKQIQKGWMTYPRSENTNPGLISQSMPPPFWNSFRSLSASLDLNTLRKQASLDSTDRSPNGERRILYQIEVQLRHSELLHHQFLLYLPPHPRRLTRILWFLVDTRTPICSH